MYKTLQLFTNTFTFNINKFTSIKLIKTHAYKDKVIKNAKLIKTWVKLKHDGHFTMTFTQDTLSGPKHCMTLKI